MCATLFLAALTPSPAASAPRVQVRGHTALRLLAMEHRDAALVVTGELLDRDLLTGLPYRYVSISARAGSRSFNRRVRTDRWGRFRLHLPANLRGNLVVSSTFAGDGYYASQELAPRTVDVSKKALDLGLLMDRQLQVTAATQKVAVTTRVDGQPVSVPVTLHDSRGRLLARLVTGRAGRAEAAIPTAKLGRPGPVTVQATFAGNSALNRAGRRFEAVLVSPVSVELTATPRRVPADGEISLTGRITDHSGGVPAAALGIFAMGERADTAVSDAAGRFTVRLPASGFAAGALDLQARYSPDVAWRLAGRSPAVAVQVLAPRPISPRLYLLPALISALVVLGLALVRQRRRITRYVRALRAPAATEPPPTGGQEERIESGLRLSRRTIRALIKPSDRISGEVWDATDTSLIPEAVISLRPEQGPTVEVRSGGSGRFETPSLPAGGYAVTVSRDGYVSERFNARLPHRGSLHDVRVDMVQVRVRILEVYCGATRDLLPREELWACWTPRELVHHLGRQRGRRSRPLELLTRLLEYAYWGTEPPPEELLRQAKVLAADLPAEERWTQDP